VKLTVLKWGSIVGAFALVMMVPAMALSLATQEFRAVFVALFAFTAITAAGYWVAKHTAPRTD